MLDKNIKRIYLGIFKGLKLLNNFNFFDFDFDSSLGYTEISYENINYPKLNRSLLNLSSIALDKEIEKSIKKNKNPLFKKIKNNFISKPYLNSKIFESIISSYFNSKEEIKENSYKYFNNSLNIIQNYKTDFIEIEINNEFKEDDELYFKVPKLNDKDHLIEIYYPIEYIELFPDSNNNTIIFKFIKKYDNFKFSFRVSKFSSFNLINFNNDKFYKKPSITLNGTGKTFFLEKDEVKNIEERKYKEMNLFSNEEISLILENSKEYKKINFLYINEKLSNEQLTMDLLLDFTNVSSISFHTLCHLRHIKYNKNPKKITNPCDWIYYHQIFRILEHLSAELILSRSMNKILNREPEIYKELKTILKNKKFINEDKKYIPQRVLEFLNQNDLFISCDDISLLNRILYLKKLIFLQEKELEKKIHYHLTFFKKSYTLPIIFEIYKPIMNIEIDIKEDLLIRKISDDINDYFDFLTSFPLLHVIDYIEKGTKYSGYKHKDLLKKKKSKSSNNNSLISSNPSLNEVNNVTPIPPKQSFFKGKPFIAICVTGSILTVIGGVVYTLI